MFVWLFGLGYWYFGVAFVILLCGLVMGFVILGVGWLLIVLLCYFCFPLELTFACDFVWCSL